MLRCFPALTIGPALSISFCFDHSFCSLPFSPALLSHACRFCLIGVKSADSSRRCSPFFFIHRDNSFSRQKLGFESTALFQLTCQRVTRHDRETRTMHAADTGMKCGLRAKRRDCAMADVGHRLEGKNLMLGALAAEDGAARAGECKRKIKGMNGT